MGLRGWLGNSLKKVRADGMDGIRWSLTTLYQGLWGRYWRFRNRDINPTNVYDREWDMLVVLDGCRSDVVSRYRDALSVSACDSVYSVGSTTTEWMEKSFLDTHSESMRETAYVCANPHSEYYLDAKDFLTLEEVWKYAWNENHGTVLPRPVTDSAIQIWRTYEPDKMIVHYLQPHYPFIERPDLHQGLDSNRFGNMSRRSIWEKLRAGDVDVEDVWEAYYSNLALVVEDLTLLIESVDAESIAITADHGNGFGEFGCYGHPEETDNPYVRKVPWCKTSGRGSAEYQPEGEQSEVKSDVEGRLEELGYL